MISLSCNEIEGLCQKAARGAGLSWGMAEEVGFSVGWLESKGIAGATELVALIAFGAGAKWGLRGPTIGRGTWLAPTSQPVCPFLCGAAMSDFAQQREADCDTTSLRLPPMYRPVLLLPFVAQLAARRGISVAMTCDGNDLAQIDKSGDIAWISDVFPDSGSPVLAVVTQHAKPHQTPREIMPLPDEIYAVLNAFALKTTVPASDASRSGAGAGVSDND